MNYKYNSCSSKGVCSQTPKTTSLQEVLILYLQFISYYIKKTQVFGYEDSEAENIVLNTLSLMISTSELAESDFIKMTKLFNKKIPQLIEVYNTLCKEQGIKPKHIKPVIKYDKNPEIIKSIQTGEKEFAKKYQNISIEAQSLYKILFLLIKNIAYDIIELKLYKIDTSAVYLDLICILEKLNSNKINTKNLKKYIIKIAKTDNDLYKQIRKVQTEQYGKQRPKEVSYSTKPSKAILVSGYCIKELENILNAVKDTGIDVYTHDKMIIAHTFPKFENYKNLIGQYGQGEKSGLLDFATFPGPIIFTKHSLYNVDNLYRGKLYTTDSAYSKGIIPIINQDFTAVIQSAEESKGFKSGKKCQTEIIGFDFEASFNLIKERINNNHYENIVIISSVNEVNEDNIYYKNLIKLLPKECLIISFSNITEQSNLISVNACFDEAGMINLTESIISFVKTKKIQITIIYSECTNRTISSSLSFSSARNAHFYLGACTQSSFNPALINILEDFNIKKIKNPQNDIKDFFEK